MSKELRTQKRVRQFDRINQSEKQLRDFLALKPQDKLEGFRTLIKPAIRRLHSVINNQYYHKYPNFEVLENDYLYSDIEILYIFQQDGSASFIRFAKIYKEKYPNNIINIDNAKFGIYKDIKGEKHYSKRIAANFYLDELANKWLNEIPAIEEVITLYENS